MNTLRTNLKAEDIMVSEPVCVEPSATIRELARVFVENEVSGAPVVNEQGRLVGIVSKTDLIRRCADGTLDVPPGYLFEVISEQGGEDADLIPEPLICVEDFMTADPITVTPATPVDETAQLMYEGRIHRVIVVDSGGGPLGIITSLDMLGAFPR